MSNEKPRVSPPPIPNAERKAGWWAWPMVLFSVFTIGWSVNLFIPILPETGADADAEAGAAAVESPALADPADLALLKIQSQVVIAAGGVNAKEAADTLKELKAMGGGDQALASIALLESFVDLKGANPEKTVSEISERAPDAFRQLMKKAISVGVNEDERGSLAEYVGWFAELAPAPGLETPPDAKGIRGTATALLVLGVGVFLLAVVAIVVGTIFLFMMIRKHRMHGGVTHFRKEAVPRGVMLECFALYLGLMALGEVLVILVARFDGAWIPLVSNPGFTALVYGSAVVVPFLWPLIRGVRWRAFTQSLGFHKGSGFFREVGAGILGYSGVAAIASIGIFLTILLTQLVTLWASGQADADVAGGGQAVGPATHPIVGWIYEGGLEERLFCLFLAAGFAPFFEEIFFRGALHRYLRGKFRFLASAILTGVIFAALHPQGWMGIPALASIGIGFSLLREWRDSLIAPMVAHAVNNGVLVGILCIAL